MSNQITSNKLSTNIHPNMVIFVQKYYESFDYYEFNKKHGKGRHPIVDIYLPNIRQFLDTYVIREGYDDIKVKDIPIKERLKVIYMLGLYLGITEHVGYSFAELYLKYLYD